MKPFRRALEELGFTDVESYATSGNVLFNARASDPAALERRIAGRVGTAAFVRTRTEMARVVAQDPLGAMVMFLAHPPAAAKRHAFLDLDFQEPHPVLRGRTVYISFSLLLRGRRTPFAVNVEGLVLASQEAAKRLRSGGRIVSISSSTVQAPTLGMSLYAGSKAAGDMFTRVWGKELASRGITVNSVAPGPTSPGSFDRASSELRQRALEESPSGRIGTAAEIASVVAFLCGDQASWISGQCVIVNGAGW
jgi:hypothetical protein